jgi:hypothetical protein
MLTPQEEATLKRLAAEHTPLARPPQLSHPSQSQPRGSVDTLVRREIAKGKLQTVDLDTDYGIINILRDAGVLDKKETLGSFYSRTGLGRAQIIAWRKDLKKIRAFVQQVEKNDKDQGFCAPKTLPQNNNSIPQRLVYPRAVIVG